MDLETSLKTLFTAQDNLRTPRGVNDPDYISQNMQRLAIASGAVEQHLAEYERDYELELGRLLGQYLVTEGVPVTAADRRVKIELAKQKAEITYLSRIVSSAWKLTSIAQSRHNHLTKEFKMGGTVT